MNRNLPLISWILFFYRLSFHSPIIVLYFIDITGSYAMGMSMLAVQKMTLLAMDIPTGILSDKIGRKKTAIIGALCKVVGFSLLALSSSSAMGIALAYTGVMFIGLSFAFFSGNNSAILYETLQSLDKGDQLYQFLGKKIDSAVHISLFVSCVIGGFIAQAKGFNFAIWMSVIPSIICVVISFFIVETRTHSKDGLKALAHLKRSIKLLAQDKRPLKIFAGETLDGFVGAVYRMEVVFVKTFLPLWGVGVFKGFMHFSLAVSYRYAGKIINTIGYKKSIIDGNFWFSAVQIIAYLLSNIFSPVLIILSYLFKGYAHSASKTLIQQQLSNKERTTMFSIISMTKNFTFSLMLVAMGALADRVGLANAAITFIVIKMVLLMPLYISYFSSRYSFQK